MPDSEVSGVYSSSTKKVSACYLIYYPPYLRCES